MSEDVVVEAAAETTAQAAPAVEKVDAAPAAEAKTEGNALASDPPANVGPSWGEDWREKLAGDDADMLKAAKRYTDPKALLKTAIEQQKYISSGKHKQPLDLKTATPEQVSEYRKANNIPETWDKYEVNLGDGMVLSDADKATVDGFKELAHGLNAPASFVEAAVKYQLAKQQERAAQIAEKDQADIASVHAELGSKWGPTDFKLNRDGINNMLGQMDAKLADGIKNSRMPDGTALFNHPGVWEWMSNQARMLGFVGHTVVAPSVDDGKSATARLAELRAMMADENSPYRKGPQAEALQKEYRTLSELTSR